MIFRTLISHSPSHNCADGSMLTIDRKLIVVAEVGHVAC